MPRKRQAEAQGQQRNTRVRAANSNDGDDAEVEEQPVQQTARREGMAEVARRRAAHFANFQVGDDDDDRSHTVHTGTDNIRELGPWSSARALVEARADAAQQRTTRLASTAGPSTTAQPIGMSISWSPSRDPAQGPRPEDCVPSLFSLCVGIVVHYLEDVESLWGLPEALKIRIAEAAAAQRKLKPSTMGLFVEHAPSEIVLLDCTALDTKDAETTLRTALTPSLQKLHLRFCGRGLAPSVLTNLLGTPDAPHPPLSNLTTLMLEGAYRMTDAGVVQWLLRGPELQHLELPEASLLDGSFLSVLPRYTPHLQTLNIAKCRGVKAEHLLAVVRGLPHLNRLNVSELPAVDDSILQDLALYCPNLQHLVVDKCVEVTDKGIQALAARCTSLKVLWMDNCSRLTDEAMHALATHCRRLEVLSVRRCSKLSDGALAHVATMCTLRTLHTSHVDRVGPLTMSALAHAAKERLEKLDVSFCRHVTDDALGAVVDACPYLATLTVFGCSQLTNRLLHGHGHASLVVEGRGERLVPVVLP